MFNYKGFMQVQKHLNAPKNQYNSFGKYKYRSCEDIIEAAKPLCIEHGFMLVISDSIELIGDRYYVKATATVVDSEGGSFEASAYAREELDKKGMDSAQLTGSTSSYARKYALNGLFAIDDSKDSDTDAYKQQQDKDTTQPKKTIKTQPDKPTPIRVITPNEAADMLSLCAQKGVDIKKVMAKYEISELGLMQFDMFTKLVSSIEKMEDKK